MTEATKDNQLDEFRTTDPTFSRQTSDINNNLFFNLHNFLFNLFMNVKFSTQNFQLNDLERQIIKNIVLKKKFEGYKQVEFSKKFFNRAANTDLKKKKEDGLKFIFKKAIKKIKNDFKINQLQGIRLNAKELDRHFYAFHFQKIADQEGLPLQCFYHFRNWQNRESENIPKSITKDYVRKLKKNPQFVLELKNYLENELIKSFTMFNSKKIRTMIIKWEKMIEDHGREQGIKTIIKNIHSIGNKIPWTLSEVYHALQDSLKYIHNS